MNSKGTPRSPHPALVVVLAVAVLALTVGGCGGEEEEVAQAPPPAVEPEVVELEVEEVLVGRTVGADRRVGEETEEFAPADTIHVSVETEGTEAGTLAARLSFEDGQEVDRQERSIQPNGPEVTEFHFAKPDGWPEGEYTVEVTLDGEVVEEREIEVVG